MGSTVWPADAVSGAPSYTGRALRQTIGVLAAGKAARPLGATSGVVAGTPHSVVSATSTTWTVGPHAGVIDGEASAVAGPYFYAFDSNQTGGVNAADGSFTRLDLLSVQLSDPAEGDGTSTPAIAVVYTPGTPAGSPTLPAGPARSMPLAIITVPASGGGAPSVTWAAQSATAAGGVVPALNDAYRNALAAYEGLLVWNMGANRLEVYDGSAWVPAVLPASEQHQLVELTPGSTLSTPVSGTATWIPLGNITIPDWATQVIAHVNINSCAPSSGSALNDTAFIKIGTVGGTSHRIPGSTDTVPRSFGWASKLTGLASGTTVPVVVAATFGAGSGTFQVGTDSFITMTLTFLP